MSDIDYKSQQNSIDARDMEGNTALHYCAMFQNVELAKFLVKCGARTTILKNCQETAATIVVNLDSGTESDLYNEVFKPLLNVEWTTATESSELFPEFFPDTHQ